MDEISMLVRMSQDLELLKKEHLELSKSHIISLDKFLEIGGVVSGLLDTISVIISRLEALEQRVSKN